MSTDKHILSVSAAEDKYEDHNFILGGFPSFTFFLGAEFYQVMNKHQCRFGKG